jgi:hypothetical protein
MNKQTTIEAGTLSAAMALAFAEIEGATKSVTGQVGQQKYKYADLGSVIDAIKPHLVTHGLFFTQRCQPSEDGVIVETVLHHACGDEMPLGSLFVPANKRDAQGFGSALTYARRYGLMTAFGVPAEDDDGNAAAQSYTPRAAGKGPPVNDTNGGNGKDAPFPQGPAKNKTELKAMCRDLWRDVEGSGDPDELEILLASKETTALVAQMMKALPSWWDGGTDAKGETFEGMEAVIARRRKDFEQLETVGGGDWRTNPINGG